MRWHGKPFRYAFWYVSQRHGREQGSHLRPPPLVIHKNERPSLHGDMIVVLPLPQIKHLIAHLHERRQIRNQERLVRGSETANDISHASFLNVTPGGCREPRG